VLLQPHSEAAGVALMIAIGGLSWWLTPRAHWHDIRILRRRTCPLMS